MKLINLVLIDLKITVNKKYEIFINLLWSPCKQNTLETYLVFTPAVLPIPVALTINYSVLNS